MSVDKIFECVVCECLRECALLSVTVPYLGNALIFIVELSGGSLINLKPNNKKNSPDSPMAPREPNVSHVVSLHFAVVLAVACYGAVVAVASVLYLRIVHLWIVIRRVR